jgi:coenzyme F420-dependent glucose-6-phosphate dehydrogenase
MVEIGYSLSSEEHRPNDLVRAARRAEEVGFTFALISDHFHPWIDKQGQSPFVWTVLGGIAQATERLHLGTGVTCPILRYHPAILAQAAATVAAMMPGRFFLGVGTGENLNEHVLGQHWPPYAVRLEMLEEAIGVLRMLWQGGVQSHRGRYYTVENARIYTLPEERVPIYVAGTGPEAVAAAGRLGDGFISTAPQKELVQGFERAGGQDKPRIGQLTVCWARTEAEARRIAFEWWPTAALKGEVSQELALPQFFEQAAQLATEDAVAEAVVCGPDAEKHLSKIRAFGEAGFDQVYVHQVGPDQEGFFRFYEREILPQFQAAPAQATR